MWHSHLNDMEIRETKRFNPKGYNIELADWVYKSFSLADHFVYSTIPRTVFLSKADTFMLLRSPFNKQNKGSNLIGIVT